MTGELRRQVDLLNIPPSWSNETIVELTCGGATMSVSVGALTVGQLRALRDELRRVSRETEERTP